EDDALELVLRELRGMGAETLLQVGDIADGPGDAERCIALLKEHRVLCVRGNHDRWLLANQHRDLPYARPLAATPPSVTEFLSQLPATREFRSPRGHVLLCHGLGSNDMAGVHPDSSVHDISSNEELQRLIQERRYRFVMNGHTHRSMLRTFGPVSIVNAGSLLRDHDRAFTLVDLERGDWVRYRHVANAPLGENLASWFEDRQALADSPSEPFREPSL
ncbi:MAG TPA: metallophosphoesterase family protein, partial [Polyangiaceae bacterium]